MGQTKISLGKFLSLPELREVSKGQDLSLGPAAQLNSPNKPKKKKTCETSPQILNPTGRHYHYLRRPPPAENPRLWPPQAFPHPSPRPSLAQLPGLRYHTKPPHPRLREPEENHGLSTPPPAAG